jgi:hypothetical protein
MWVSGCWARCSDICSRVPRQPRDVPVFFYDPAGGGSLVGPFPLPHDVLIRPASAEYVQGDCEGVGITWT